jgi:hypothetical protein
VAYAISHSGREPVAKTITEPIAPLPHTRYQTGPEIAERLATADPDNAQYQRDLSISHSKLEGIS